jgi:hypothetical protein
VASALPLQIRWSHVQWSLSRVDGFYRLIVTAIFGNHTTHSGLAIHL